MFKYIWCRDLLLIKMVRNVVEHHKKKGKGARGQKIKMWSSVQEPVKVSLNLIYCKLHFFLGPYQLMLFNPSDNRDGAVDRVCGERRRM